MCGKRSGSLRRLADARFGIGVGTLVLAANVVLLSCYTLRCHSFRHMVGGFHDELSKHPAQQVAYDCASYEQMAHALGLDELVHGGVRRCLRAAVRHGRVARLADL